MFELKVPRDQLVHYSRRYQYRDDEAALEAGKLIASGHGSRAALSKIFEWKTRGRGKSRLLDNTDAEIVDALQLAVTAKTDRCAIAVLLGLRGVAIPVASAILTAINPERYSIIDFRALWSLSVDQVPIYTIGYYLDYLAFCKAAAARVQLSLRDFDRALWRFSKEHQRD